MVVDVRWRQRRRLILRLRRFLVHWFGGRERPLEVFIFRPRPSELCPCPKRLSVFVGVPVQETVVQKAVVQKAVGSTLVLVAAIVAAVVAAFVAAGAAFVAVSFAAFCVEPICVDESSAADVECVARCLWR